GIDSNRLQTAQGAREVLREVTETGTVIAEGLRLLRGSAGWLLLVWALALPATLFLFGLLLDFLSDKSDAGWLDSVKHAVSWVFGLATTTIASWRTVVKPRLQPLVDLVVKTRAKRAELEIQVEKESRIRAGAVASTEEEVIAAQLEATRQS